MRQPGAKLQRDFGMRFSRFLTSRETWLALDDGHCDSRRRAHTRPLVLEAVNEEELTEYHRQLFYWLLFRHEPGVFSTCLSLYGGASDDDFTRLN